MDKTVVRSSERRQGRAIESIFNISIKEIKGFIFPGGAVNILFKSGECVSEGDMVKITG